MRIATGEQMREIDRTAIEQWGFPSAALMEVAGRGAAEALLEVLPAIADAGGPVTVVCGKGNNGGDGFVVARHLANRGLDVTVVLLAALSELSGDAAAMAEVWSHMGEVIEVSDADEWARAADAVAEAAVIVDGILGTGLSSAPRGKALKAIEAIIAAHDSGAWVLALDVPSGVVADDGTVPGKALEADLTATLGAGKHGVFSYPGAAYAGSVRVIDLGFPRSLLGALEDRYVDADDVLAALARFTETAHKGQRGRVLVVAGSEAKPGAAVLSAEGALRAGAGLVTVATASSGTSAVVGALREAMTEPLATDHGEISKDVVAHVLELAGKMDAVVVGPGMGTGPGPTALVKRLIEACDTPLVLDADAIHIVAGLTDTLRARSAPVVLTPHPGEFSVLTGVAVPDVGARRLPLARKAAEDLGVVMLLKGARTVIADADGRVAINPAAQAGLATAGSGDVLSGVVAALLAAKSEAYDAAWCAAWLHGVAGDLARGELGPRGFLARDIAARLPAALERALLV